MFLILTGCGGGSAEPEHTAPEALTSATAAGGPAQGHLDRLNEIRAAAGLQRLERNGALALAAQRHADYQTLNGVSGHSESAGNPGYSGTGYGDRAAAAGYAGRLVAEVTIGGTPSTADECRQFMDVMLIAPGHRSVLLGHEFNEAGVGGNPLTTLLGTRGTPWVAPDRLTLYPLNGQAGVPTRFATTVVVLAQPRELVSQFTTGAF